MARGLLNDSLIRAPLHRWLAKLHLHEDGTQILHELKIPRPSGRIDVAVINGELSGFEIKSDIDSLARLSRQARSFETVFDRIFIVTTNRHADAAKLLVPEWWGIILSDDCPSDFNVVQRSNRNIRSSAGAQLQMLGRRELRHILHKMTIERVPRSEKRARLVEIICQTVSDEDIRSEVKLALKERANHC